MTTPGPTPGETPACRGLVMRDVAGDEYQGRGHCRGCAEAAGLREQLAALHGSYGDACAGLVAAEALALTNGAERDELRGRVARLENELRGVAEDVDGECLCDGPDCLCGGDGDVDDEPLEMGCAGCWAVRLRQVAGGVDWPPRVLASHPAAAAIPEGTPIDRK